MDDGAAILKAILDDPADDLPRLAYADWLEESGGDIWHARFIRAQILKARAPGWWECAGTLCCEPRGHVDCEYGDAIRDSDLFLPEAWEAACPAPRPPWLAVAEPEGYVALGLALYRRGFIDEVTCRLDEWREYGPALSLGQPLKKVAVADKGPTLHFDSSYNRYAYAIEDFPDAPPWRLPSWLADHFPVRPARLCFMTEQAALDALSAACLGWAKGQAASLV